MTGDGAVRRLVLVLAVGGHQHAGHHRQRTERRRDHIAHHVAVVVLASPDKAALRADHTRHRIVDEGVEIFQTRRLKLRLELVFVNLGKDVLKAMIVGLGNGVLGGEPQILLGIQRIAEAGAGKAADGRVGVVHTHHNAFAAKVVDIGTGDGAVRSGDDQLRLAAGRSAQLGVLINIAVGVTRQGDRLFPGGHRRGDAADRHGSTEHGAVHNGADGAVGAFPHLLEVVFLDPLLIRGDGGALDADAVLLAGLRRFDGHLVVGRIAILQTEVVIFALEIHEREDELVLDRLPQHAGHLVAVHLDERGGHLNFLHDTHAFLKNRVYYTTGSGV